MSGIKYEMLTGDDLISALRGGRTGDLLDDAAYAAADEIERLRGLLQRHYELRGKPAREEWVDGGPTYRLAMQLWRDTAAALAGAADQPKAARTPAEDACMDIFNDWDESEIKDRSRSVQYAWEAGRQLQEAMRAADPTLPIP